MRRLKEIAVTALSLAALGVIVIGVFYALFTYFPIGGWCLVGFLVLLALCTVILHIVDYVRRL